MSADSVISRIMNIGIPNLLYHYTSSVGLIGIVTSKQIWTTKIHYLNDKTELQLAFDYIRHEIDMQARGLEKTQSDEELDNKKESLNSIDKVNVCVTSFTEEGDQLSQWRGYCDIGNGYSLGFHGQRLLEIVMAHKGYHLVPCVYDEQIHKLMVKELVNSTTVFNIKQNPNYNRAPFYEMSFEEAALFLAPIIKSQSFKEEKEWRLISPPLVFDNSSSFRYGAHSLIPYWKFEINPTETLASIIVGPTPEPDLSEEALSGFLAKELLSSQTTSVYELFQNIRRSEIPYRKV